MAWHDFAVAYTAWCFLLLACHIAVLRAYTKKYRSAAERLALKRASEFTMVVTAAEIVQVRRDILEEQARCIFAITEESLTPDSGSCSDAEAFECDMPAAAAVRAAAAKKKMQGHALQL